MPYWRQVLASQADAPRPLKRSASVIPVRGATFTRTLSGRERDRLFVATGEGSRYTDAAYVLGADLVDDSRGSVLADLDGDGDLDLLVRSETPHKLHLLRNDGPAAPSVTVRFATTRDAAGAVLELVLPDGQLRRSPLLLGQGFLAEDPPERLLALPKAGARLRVVWPGQAVFDVGEVRPGELVRLRRYPQPASDILARPAPLPLGPPYTPPARICDLEKMRAELPEDDTALRPDLEASRRPLVVNVWAPWCEACMEELPGLVAAARAHPGVEVRLLAVEASPAEVRAALTGRRAGLPSARTRAGMPWRFGRALRLPTTCVYDASRRLLRMIPRPLDRGRFEDLMQTALEAAAPTPSAE